MLMIRGYAFYCGVSLGINFNERSLFENSICSFEKLD